MKKKIVVKRDELVTEKEVSSLDIKKITLKSGLRAGASCCSCHTANSKPMLA